MEVIREIRRVKDRQVTIKLPDDFNETEVEILILPARRDTGETGGNKEVEEDIIQALEEVKMIREGRLPKKTAEEFLSEL